MNEVVSNAFERHAQTALVLLLVALLVWFGKTTQETSITVAEIKVELEFLRGEINQPHSHGNISGEITAIRDEIRLHIKECDKARAQRN